MKKMQWSLLVVGVLCVFTICLSYSVSAKEGQSTRQKLVKSVYIENGDCIWNIAMEYFQVENENIESYVNEIKRCNNLSSDKIYAGQNLIIPYYA